MSGYHKKLAAAVAFFFLAFAIYMIRFRQQIGAIEPSVSAPKPPAPTPTPLPSGPPILWSFQSDSSIEATPAIGPGGNLYVTSYKTLYAFSAQGTLLWQYYPGFHLMAAPMVNSEGDVFIADTACYLHRLNSKGAEMFTMQLGSPGQGQYNPQTDLGLEGRCMLRTPPALYHDDLLFVGNLFGSMFAVNAVSGGTTKRFYGIRGSGGPPVIAPDGSLIAAEGNNLTSFDTAGNILWQKAIGAASGHPAIVRGQILVAVWDHKLLAFDLHGKPLWELAGDFMGTPVIDGHGITYISDRDAVYAIQDGKQLWRTEIRQPSGITLAADGTLYTGGLDRLNFQKNCLYALRSDGAFKWSLSVEGTLKGPPAIGLNGIVYFGTSLNNISGTVYAVREENGGLARDGWPKAYGAESNDGNVPAPLTNQQQAESKNDQDTAPVAPQPQPSPTQSSTASGNAIHYFPVKLNVLPESVLVPQGASTHYRIIIPGNARNGRFEGEYKITPYPQARLDVAILAESSFANSSGSSADAALYRNNSKAADKFSVPVQPGIYYLVINNQSPADSTNGPWLAARRGIEGGIHVVYERPQ